MIALALAATLGCATGLGGAPTHRDATPDTATADTRSDVPSAAAIVVGAGTATSPTYRVRVRLSARSGAGS